MRNYLVEKLKVQYNLAMRIGLEHLKQTGHIKNSRKKKLKCHVLGILRIWVLLSAKGFLGKLSGNITFNIHFLKFGS